MAEKAPWETFVDQKLDNIFKNRGGTADPNAPFPGPHLGVGPQGSPYAILPNGGQRDPNDPMDRALGAAGNYVGRVGQALGFFGRPSNAAIPNPSGGVIPEVATGGPTMRDVSREALGFPNPRSMDQAIGDIAAMPSAPTPEGRFYYKNPFITREEAGAPKGGLPQGPPTGDMTLVNSRAPYGGISYNPKPEEMDNYEYGGKFNGKDVWFWKDKPKETDFQGALNNAVTAFQDYLANPGKFGPNYGHQAGQAIINIANAMQTGPNAASERAYKAAQTGAIPSQVEENQARAKYYGREQPITARPGDRIFLPAGQGPSIPIAEGAPERPAAAGAFDKMDEFDKIQYQTMAHLAGNSLDPEVQKRAYAAMDEIEGKYGINAGAKQPGMDRGKLYTQIKAKHPELSDNDINKYLDSRGIK